MPPPSFPPVAEPEADLRQRLRRERNHAHKARLHLLLLIQTGEVATQGDAARRLAVHENTIRRWLHRYRDGGLEALLAIGTAGCPPGQRTLPEPVFEALKRRLDEPEGFASYVAIQDWLREEYGLEVPYTTVHGLVRYRLKAKLKRPRPRHDKKKPPTQPASSSV
jgi:transposase